MTQYAKVIQSFAAIKEARPKAGVYHRLVKIGEIGAILDSRYDPLRAYYGTWPAAHGIELKDGFRAYISRDHLRLLAPIELLALALEDI